MIDPVRELKVRAELFQRRVASGHPSALSRLRLLPELRAAPEAELQAAAQGIRRRQCLSVLSRELGFSGWPQARAVLSGDPGASDFGTLLYPAHCEGFLNLWYRSHEDAEVGHRASGGYLLGYRRQCLVVGRSFIETLGLGPDAPEWQRLGFDWVRPHDVQARTALYGELVAQLPREEER